MIPYPRDLIRLIVLVSTVLWIFAAIGLATVLPPVLAAVIAFALVGPCVHALVGTMMKRRSQWGDKGRVVIFSGIAYPVLLCIVGIVYVAVTRPLAQSALILGVPVVIVVVAALVWDPNRGPRRAAARERQAIATERGWQFIADGTDVLGDRWATQGERPQVTATSVLAGDIDGRPWTAPEYLGTPTAEKLYLASSDHAFGDRLASPEIRRATIDRNLMFWRIKGRDLSISRPAQGRRIPPEQTLRTASDLVALARALPPELISTYGKPPQQGLPFRAQSPHDTPQT